MKRLLMLAAMITALAGVAEAKHPEPSAGFGVFYSSLSPYGDWVNVSFGTAWRPLHVAHGWRPYMYGQWVWSDYGWYWVSNEPFGWATFHYGRWIYDDYYGWIWIPGDVWGPAWVEWRYDDDYIGWAPLSPYATFDVSIGVTYADRWAAPVHYWNFVPCRYFTTTHVVDYVQPVDRTRRFFGETRAVVNIQSRDNRIVNRGVDVGFVERRTNTRVNRVDIVDGGRGNGDRFVRDANRERVEVYRPRVEGQTRGDVRRSDQPGRGDVRTNNRPEIGGRQQGRDAGRQPGVIQEQAPARDRRPEVSRPAQRDQQMRDQQQRAVQQQREQQMRDQQQRAVQQQREQQMRDQQQRAVQQQRDQRQYQNRNENRVQPQPQRQMRDQRQGQIQNRDNPRVQRQQPQVRQRPQPAPRPAESRGGREGKRRP